MSRNQPATHPHFDAARISSLLLPVLAFAAGFGVMFSRTSLQVSPQIAPYLGLAVLAGIDSVLGGVRAGMESKFHSDVFLSGFFLNTVAAVALVWFGDSIGLQDVFVGAAVVFTWRILVNISIIRRFFIERGRAQRAALASAPSSERAPEAPAGTDIVGA